MRLAKICFLGGAGVLGLAAAGLLAGSGLSGWTWGWFLLIGGLCLVKMADCWT